MPPRRYTTVQVRNEWEGRRGSSSFLVLRTVFQNCTVRVHIERGVYNTSS
jgi:hypothetical protein